VLVQNATVVTWERPNRLLPGSAVRIESGQIAAIGSSAKLSPRSASEEVIDAGGQLVLPGNICAHTHFYGALARGMALPGSSPKDFPEILEKLWWRLDRALGPEDVRYCALVSMLDAIHHGTTTLFDHHASPECIPHSLDWIEKEVERAGLRAVLCYEVTDRNGASGAKQGIAENVRFLSKPKAETIRAAFGLHASLTLSDQTLKDCRAAAPSGTGFHVHIAEHEADEYDSLEKSGLRIVERFEKAGVLGDRTIAAHCVHVDFHEGEILARSGAWVTHQPRSNMNNGVGVAPVEALLNEGAHVCLGNDGFSNAMWDEWKAAFLVQKVVARDPRRASADQVVEMGVYQNAALASLYFAPLDIGVLRPGAAADLMLVDYHPTTPLTQDNLPSHILFGFENSMVTSTMVAGNWLMRNRQLLTLDEARITSASRELARALWKRVR
jgi:putative selenium metabolism protein SsnA